MKWRIYYGDGSTYSDRDGSPFYAPAGNAQVICKERFNAPRPFGMMTKGECYRWCGDTHGWRSGDMLGYWDYMFNYVGPKAVLFGRTLPEDVWQGVMRKAKREGLG